MNEQTDTTLALREKRRQEMAETEFTRGTQGGALMQPRNGRELLDMANTLAGSGTMIKDMYRNNPGDCMGLIMICQPYGFNPFMVSWKTYKASKGADAPISFESQLVNAMVNMSAPVKGRLRYHYEGEGEKMTCRVVGIDRETGEEIDYVSPEFGKIPTKNSPLWKADPQQQLGYYSARAWCRRHFPELLLGVYTREEIDEAPSIRDVTPKETAFTKLVNKARTAADAPARAPENAQDGDTIDGQAHDAPDTQPALSDEEISAGAFPGADAFDHGVSAFEEGRPETDCPYDVSEARQEAIDWIGGYRQARRAKG